MDVNEVLFRPTCQQFAKIGTAANLRRPEMSLENATRPVSTLRGRGLPNKCAQIVDGGREKRALDRFCEIAQENSRGNLAERVGVPERNFSKCNEYAGFPA
jgi:hypothetical protein